MAAAEETGKTHTNRLIKSEDPYLLLHARNPVDWYPWGPEALARARRENKPIFLSIGYSTCYWCHVAERELYSDPEIARLMNKWFINIKVDREERPDLDSIYIAATELLTGHGGWPNNLFLTPGLKPFYAGSYFPPKAREGSPGFPDILRGLHKAWTMDRDRAEEVGEKVYEALMRRGSEGASATAQARPDIPSWSNKALAETAEVFDASAGGFGSGPTKFPKAPLLSMLLVSSEGEKQGHEASGEKALEMLTATLTAMAGGGLMDQLGGGFHRYSTDPEWGIPHFEKMLYDNAQLLGIYAGAYVKTKNPFFRIVAERTARYLTEEMEAPGGGFYSAEDAEVNGVEGESYVWTRKEIESTLSATEARSFFSIYALTPMPPAPMGHKQSMGGVLRLKKAKAEGVVSEIKALKPLSDRLLTLRRKRRQPARDEKIVTSDNALAVIGFTAAGKALDDNGLRESALRTANWLWTHAFNTTRGEMRHQFFKGQGGGPGFLDDYALTGEAFMAIYHATGSKLWLKRAVQITDVMLKRFTLPNGALTTSGHRLDLIVNPPARGDSTRPSGLSAAIGLLLDVAESAHERRYSIAALRALAPIQKRVSLYPAGWGSLMASLGRPPIAGVLTSAERDRKNAGEKIALDSASHLRTSGRWVQTGESADVILTIIIEAGYHINANPPSAPYLVATELILDKHPDLKVEYPPSKTFRAKFAAEDIAVYDGNITLKAHMPPAFFSEAPLAVSLRVQACDDTLCLAPAMIKVPLRDRGTSNKE